MLRRNFCQVAGAATGWLLVGGIPRFAFANLLLKDNHLQIATDNTFAPGVLVVDISGGVKTIHYSTPLSDGQTYFWRQTIVVNNQHVQVYHGRLTDVQLAELLDLYDDELLPFIDTVSNPKKGDDKDNGDDQGEDHDYGDDGGGKNGKTGDAVPERYDLGHNYPNPFNDRTTVPISLPADGLVNLTVYDSTGRQVATVVNEVMRAGTHHVDWRPSGLTSGSYLMVLNVNGLSRTQNVILVR